MANPKILWQPDDRFKEQSNLTSYLRWLDSNRNLTFTDYSSLWEWSTQDIEGFWQSIWDYFEIISETSFSQVVSDDPMPQTKWFEGSSLNYSEHIFRKASEERPAIICELENGDRSETSWEELQNQVGSFAQYLRNSGVQKGDTVAAWLPNIPEAIVAFLAVNSIGAIWSSTSPDFGTSSVIDRFSQIQPKVLLVADGYSYNGKIFSKQLEIEEIVESLTTVELLVVVDFIGQSAEILNGENRVSWEKVISGDHDIEFTRVPFSHPIWVLYSSGTTGLPKAITHSHGGVLLEHLKFLAFHNDVKPGEKFFWYSTTGWMMWNYTIGSLLCGSTVILYEGAPAYPDISRLWEFTQDNQINHFGTSAPYIIANMKADQVPKLKFDLSSLKSIGSTGAPLPPEGFDWVYENICRDVWLTSISGGSDVCSAFVGGNPHWPVYQGEIQCRALGCDLDAFDPEGNSLMDEVGEMVIKKPMPSMPIYFWGDINYERYKESYFSMYPGIWRHGDWTSITPRSGIIIYGRSDSTLNRGGVRIGTSEIYRVLDRIPEIADSLIVCLDREGGEFYMPLFVVLRGHELSEPLVKSIKSKIREECTPRHVPDEIIEISEVPYTISGKKTETPVKKILMGQDLSKSLNKDALKNPKSLDIFVEIFKADSLQG